MGKQYALVQHGVAPFRIYAIFPEERMDDVLAAFLQANMKVWSDFHFAYDKAGKHRSLYEKAVAQGNWRAALGAVKRCAMGVSYDVAEVREASFNSQRFAHALMFFRDGFGQCEWISFQDDLDKIDEDKCEVGNHE